MDKFSYFRSYYEALKGMKAKSRYAIREAIDEYMFEGKEPTFGDSLSKAIWSLLLPTLDKSKTYFANGKLKSKSEANQKLIESKLKVNEKQNGSKNEANVSYRIRNKEKDKEEEKKEEKKTPAGVRSASASPVSKFIKPTLDQVKEHIKAKGYHFDAESFYAFYESKGWKVGNQSMKSWEMACITWEKRMPHTETLPQEEEYHPIVPLDKCKVCGSKLVATKGMHAICLNNDCGVSFTWNKNDWREDL